MTRIGGLFSAVLLMALLPAAASAQDDNRYTRDAERNIGLAMIREDDAQRRELYQQALNSLTESMQSEPDHAKTWFLAGQVQAALGQYAEADASFDRAVELHPPYAEEVGPEREQAWIFAFRDGVARMDTQDYAGAIELLEAANALYPDRPEAYLNLGSLYANDGDLVKAQEAYQAALAITTAADSRPELDDETRAQWNGFTEMARSNLAQMSGQAGVQAFQDEDFALAAEMFAAAAEGNPYARDFHFNLSQALFAQTQELEAQRDSAMAANETAEVNRLNAELMPIYDQLLAASEKTLEFDPNNEMMYVLQARAHRMKGMMGDGAAQKSGQDLALELLTKRSELPVEVVQFTVRETDAGAEISGTMLNKNVAAGETITMHVTLIGAEGQTIGEGDVTVTAPEADVETQFQGTVPASGEVAGWKYVIR